MTLDDRLSSRQNGLDVVRLVLAVLVIVSHAWPLGYGHPDPRIGSTSLGTLAVYGFFGISGYVVTQSRDMSARKTFLARRVARIFPGFLVMLAVVVLVLAPVAWILQGHGLGSYPIADGLRFVARDFTTRATDGFPASLPTAHVRSWVGQAWSLWSELLCYVLLLMAPRRLLAPLALLLIVDLSAYHLTTVELTGAMSTPPFTLTLLVFSAGMALHAVRRHMPVDPRLTIAAGAVAAAALTTPHGAALAAIPLTYFMLSLGALLPNVTPRRDLSYGTYLYGFAVAQVLAAAGLSRLGAPLYGLLTVAISLALAWASWVLVERPATQMASRRRGEGPDRVAAATATGPVGCSGDAARSVEGDVGAGV